MDGSTRPTCLRVFIRGPFRVTDGLGNDLTPRSKKTQGLIALLVTADGFRRSRAFLQDQMWSDRGQAQGAASLRQALTELRRLFGMDQQVLFADRSAVWLDPDRIELVSAGKGMDASVEIFEGLDIKDPEFNRWLVNLRTRSSNPISSNASKVMAADRQQTRQIIFHTHADGWAELGFAEEVMTELVAQNLREQATIEIHKKPPEVTRKDALIVDIQSFAPSGGFGMRSTIQSVSDGSVLWSDMQPIPTLPGYGNTPPELLAASTRTSNAIVNCFVSMPDQAERDWDANLLALLGTHKIFALRPDDSIEARRLLKAAYDRNPRGVYLAWLAQLCTVNFAEGFAPRDEMANEAEAFIAKALETEGENSQVLTVAANCAMVFNRDPETGGHLARMALRSNPANAMAWWALGHIQLYAGKYDDSYHTSLQGQRLAQGTNLQFWLDFQKSLAAAFCGKLDEARIHSQASSVLRPEFRAAHRFAMALHSAADDKERSLMALRKLSKLETDFSPARMALDKDYPASLIRQMPFFAPAKILDLDGVS